MSLFSYLWAPQTSLNTEPVIINNITDEILKFNAKTLRKVETKELTNTNMNEFMRQREHILKNGNSISVNHDKELAELAQYAHMYLMSYLQSSELMRKQSRYDVELTDFCEKIAEYYKTHDKIGQLNAEEQEQEDMLNALFDTINKSKEILKKEYKLVKVYNGHTMSKRENYTSLARQFQYVMTSQGKNVFTE